MRYDASQRPDGSAVVTGKLPAKVSVRITPPGDQHHRTIGPAAGIEAGVHGTAGIQPGQGVTGYRIKLGEKAPDENPPINNPLAVSRTI
jgi:hypothetical protein